MPYRSHAASEDVDGLHSRLANDPDLGGLVAAFAHEIPYRIATLADCLANGEWETLGRLAHQFKSAVGSYGFDELVPFAGRVESAVREGLPEDAVEDALTALTDVCHRVRAD
jgi:HPt (histidine-containing phosphotransfer) domain-containing protein